MHKKMPLRLMPTARLVHKGSERFHAILKEMGELHDKKQQDYGSSSDPFANVRASEEWGPVPWVGAMIRATDKLRRLQTFARKGTLANEGARDSFIDLAVYAIIALVLYEEESDRPQPRLAATQWSPAMPQAVLEQLS